ncbi:hypothetical protein [Cellulomonas cellasea]|uniref:Uncharacterized protein n=2 Tax=Cellulomonas cellasea TaxID=43670 RepID=A0A0A0B259_9CELL|nr:hypothetical protein [Cellulomonas cellasea]KGM00885.1 hypothetical protein Q760_05480 [Cellulomonas cellasea DSM 20118]
MTTTQRIPRAWRDELVLALRERDVSGADIGDALAHVESFCADSGQGPDEAFGPAREHAASLRLPSGSPTPTPGPLLSRATLLRYAVGMVAVAVVGMSAASWARAEPVRLGAAHLAVTVVALACLGLLVRHLTTFVRWCTTRRWLAWIVMQAGAWAAIGLGLLSAHLLPGVGVTVPAAPLTAVAAAALVVPALVAQLRGTLDDADVLAAPLEDPATVGRRSRRANTLLTWALPLCGAVSVGVTLGLNRLIPG